MQIKVQKKFHSFLLKSFWTILLVVHFLGYHALGQTVIYTNNFDGSVSGWSSASWGLSTSHSSSGAAYTTCEVGSPSGNDNITSGSSGSTLIYNGVNTTGYSSITVQWGARMSTTGASPTFQYSINNGTSWTSVAFTDVSNNSTWGLVSITFTGGAGFANVEFRWTSNSSSNTYLFDDFCVEGASCPTTSSTLNAPTSVTCSGMTLNWTNGNGSNRIVVVYPNSTITTPTNSTSYTANTAYGSGTSIGAGFVVYNGSGTSVAVTGLSASTTYYYAVFEYNSIACYLTPGVSANHATPACGGGCPTTQATAITFTNVACSSITFSWTNGNGSDRLVVAYPTSTITSPTNGTTYTANTTYGSGTIVGAGATKGYTVYNGTGSSVTVTGLTAGTTYYFAVYEYFTTVCYLTPGLSSNDATVSAPTTAASGLTFPGVDCGDIVLDWTPGNGSNEIVVAYPNSTITAPVSGTVYTANTTYGSGSALGSGFVVFSGVASTAHIYGLSASTNYYFAVFEYNGNSCYYATSVSGNQTTASVPTTASHGLASSAITCSGMTVSWVNGNGADRIVVAYPNSTITTPSTGTVYTANTTYGSGTALGAGYVIYRGTGTTVSVTGLSASTNYYFAVFEYNGASCYYTTAPSINATTVACSGCPTTAATGLGYTSIACNSIQINWTSGNGSNRIVVAYPNSTITSPLASTTYTANTAYGSGTGLGAGFVVYNGTGSTVTVTGLSASTTYYFAVFEYNTISCYLTPGTSSSQATIACSGCPTITASALSYSHVGCNSTIVNWTKGNGVNRIVVAYPNSTITSPVNTTTYTANYTYGSGTVLGAGYVVYNGTGSTVTVLGLSASTTYYFAVFEYNTTACYLTPGTSSNVTTTSCSQCPVLVTIMTDACDDVGTTCQEGNSEFFLLSTGTYGWDNGIKSPTIMYGSTTAGTTHTISTYQTENTPTSILNSSAVSCGAGNFIDASAGGVVIPAWSTIMLGVSDEPTYDFCPNLYNFSSLCAATKPIYVLYGNNTNLVYTGNFLNHSTPAGTWRYFIADFTSISASCNVQYYEYDADLESSGNGASETWRPPISTSSAAPTAPTYNPISCGLSATLLPIKLLSFSATYDEDEKDVYLNWATGSEVDNKLFTIEKSTNGENWVEVTTLPGAGNSIHTIHYSAIDLSPYPNLSYYRLKQTDYDGNYTYSGLVPINIEVAANTIALIPNPSSKHTSIVFNSITEASAILNIYDPTGRLIDSKPLNLVKGSNTYILNVSNYPNGVYIIAITSNLQQFSAKLIINHN